MDFPGLDSTMYGYLGEVTLDAPPTGPSFSKYSMNGTVIIVPVPGGRYRVMGFDPAYPGPGELTLDQLRDSTIRVMGTDFGMRDPVWLSRFGSASRLVETYRKGRVLIAGDAAHMHFPTGGVGLNVGVQDPMNLG